MTSEHYNRLKTEIDKVLKNYPEFKCYETSPYKKQGLSAMRYRWDLLHATELTIGDGIGVMGDINLYAYLNDNHIDTALRKITNTR